jgi:predicted CoA-binding protein
MDIAEGILRESEVIAVVGASRDPNKAAHNIPKQLQGAGFRIVPVNPHADELFGQKAYRTLENIPFPIDMVLVFRPSPDAPPIAKSAVAIGAKALWLQQGIASPDARRIAREGGLGYVEDECAGVVRALHQIRKHRTGTGE